MHMMHMNFTMYLKMKHFTISKSPVMIFIFSLLLSYVTANIEDYYSTGSKVYSKSPKSLDLRKSNLTTLSPSLFSNVSDLIELDLSGNDLQIIKSNVFDQLTNLEHLIINSCNLTHLSNDAFKNLGQLKVLQLAENNFTSNVNWTLTLSYLPRLEYLNLSNSNISKLPDNAFSNNIRLRNLVLSHNKLFYVRLSTAIFQYLPDLELLDVSYSHVDPITESTFINATNLRTLILDGNSEPLYIEQTHFGYIQNLEHLSLSRCGITGFNNMAFANNTKLKYLDVSHNKINQSRFQCVSTILSLEYLNEAYNRHYISNEYIYPLINLRELIISGNLFWPERGLFAKHRHLKVLEMNDCNLSYWNINGDFTHPNLEVLKMAHNKLNEGGFGQPDPKKITNLKILDLGHNKLNHLDANVFMSNPKIEQLILEDNKLNNSNFDLTEVLKPLTNLQKLDLKFNKIMSIIPEQFNNNSQLVKLYLDYNPWKCDCYINDFKQWSKFRKNFTMADEHMIHNYPCTNYGCMRCDYDPNTSPEKRIRTPGKHDSISFGMEYRRTWADYMLEAKCPKKYYH